jgi:hypothetical protein
VAPSLQALHGEPRHHDSLMRPQALSLSASQATTCPVCLALYYWTPSLISSHTALDLLSLHFRNPCASPWSRSLSSSVVPTAWNIVLWLVQSRSYCHQPEASRDYTWIIFWDGARQDIHRNVVAWAFELWFWFVPFCSPVRDPVQ